MTTTWIDRSRERWRTYSPLRQRVLVALAVVVGVLVIVRLALPTVLRHVINDRLAKMAPYHGHVDRVGLALWRGAFALSDLTLTLHYPDGAQPEQVLTVERVDVRLNWRALFSGHIVGDIIITRPEVFLTPQLVDQGAESPPLDADGPPVEDAKQWQDHLRQLSLMHFDRILVHDGVLFFEDTEHTVDRIRLATIEARLEGLAVGMQAEGQEAVLTVSGQTLGGGTLRVDGAADPLAEQPTFSVRSALKSVSCPELNPLTQRFDNLTFEAGTFSCFIELDAADGRIDGFLKPIFTDLSIASFKDESGSAASQLFWGALIPVAEFLLENEEENQHAAEIPITGDIESPETDVWVLVVTTLRNAFIQAIIPGFKTTF